MDSLALRNRPFIKFSIIGGFATGIQYLMLIIFVQHFHFSIIPSSSVAFIMSTGISYLLNQCITFNSDKSHRKALLQYFIVYLIGCGINGCIMWVGITHLSLHYLAAQVMTSSIVLLWNYNGCRRWIYP